MPGDFPERGFQIGIQLQVERWIQQAGAGAQQVLLFQVQVAAVDDYRVGGNGQRAGQPLTVLAVPFREIQAQFLTGNIEPTMMVLAKAAVHAGFEGSR